MGFIADISKGLEKLDSKMHRGQPVSTGAIEQMAQERDVRGDSRKTLKDPKSKHSHTFERLPYRDRKDSTLGKAESSKDENRTWVDKFKRHKTGVPRTESWEKEEMLQTSGEWRAGSLPESARHDPLQQTTESTTLVKYYAPVVDHDSAPLRLANGTMMRANSASGTSYQTINVGTMGMSMQNPEALEGNPRTFAPQRNILMEEMKDIYHYLHKVKRECPKVQFEWEIANPCGFRDVEITVDPVISAYRSAILHELELEDRVKNLEIEIKGKIRELDRLEGKLLEKEDREKKHDKWIQKIHQDYRSELKKAEEEHQSKIEMLGENHRSEIQSWNTEFQKLLKKNQDNLDEANEILRDTNDSHEKQIAILLREHQEEMRKMTDRQKSERENNNKKIESMIDKHQKEKSSMKEAQKVAIEKYARDLKEENEVLKGALLRRDHFKAMSDHELGLRFQEISSDVDDLARIGWEKSQEPRWPFTDQSLQGTENPRRAKQYILQNTLWVILYEKIFCTPFRVLGEEGKSWEREWKEKFGQASNGPLCPRATPESEKWRYEAIKAALDATNQAFIMEKDPNYSIKHGYELSLKETAQEISQELKKVTQVGRSEEQQLGNIVAKAARLWLEIGQQRCRVSLLMSKPGNTPARSSLGALNRDGTLAVVVVPELRRLGNAQGERLDKEELVKGCSGVFNALKLG